MFIKVKSQAYSNKGEIIVNAEQVEYINPIDENHSLLCFQSGKTMLVEHPIKDIELKLTTTQQFYIP